MHWWRWILGHFIFSSTEVMEVLKEKSLLSNISIQSRYCNDHRYCSRCDDGWQHCVRSTGVLSPSIWSKMLVIPSSRGCPNFRCCRSGNSSSAGKVGVTTLGYFALTSALAVALAPVMGEVFEPGRGIDVSGVEGMFSSEYAAKGRLPTFWATITGMIPTNVFQSLNEANAFCKFSFSVFFGIAISKQQREAWPIINSVNAIVDAMVLDDQQSYDHLHHLAYSA